ncbi:MAG: hypothetical protein LBD78_06805 [Spirochaetaceae bacterium]|nr:hypothetical protein [Spirochaetaceae bacterium]
MPKGSLEVSSVTPVKDISKCEPKPLKGISLLIAYIQGTGLNSYKSINDYLRKKLILNESAKKKMKNDIIQIRQLMKRHEGALLVYRGMQIPDVAINKWKRDCEELRKNHTFTFIDKGFVSTSKSHVSAYNFMKSNDSVMMIILINGIELIDFEQKNIYIYTRHKDEREVLLRDGITFSFVGVVTKADCDKGAAMTLKAERYTAVKIFEEFTKKSSSRDIIDVAKDFLGVRFDMILKNGTNYILFAKAGP